MKSLYLSIVIILAIFLAGCSDNSQKDYSQFTMPDMSEMQTFEVDQVDGHRMTSHEISHTKEYDHFEAWKKRQEEKENVDRYNMIRDVYDNYKEIEEEEEELEDYCDTLHSNSCLEMEWIKDHNGCRQVKVECDKYDSDDICIRYDIDVKEDLLDEDECLID